MSVDRRVWTPEGSRLRQSMRIQDKYWEDQWLIGELEELRSK